MFSHPDDDILHQFWYMDFYDASGKTNHMQEEIGRIQMEYSRISKNNWGSIMNDVQLN